MNSLIMNSLIKIFCAALIMSVVAACSSDSSESLSYNVEVKSDRNVTFDNANIKVRLFGTDAMVADNTATVVAQSILPIKGIPSITKLQWPDNAHLLISSPPVRKKEDAIYYLNILIDANNDGLICKGDYRQDYERTPFMTVNEMPTKLLTYYMVEIDSDDCEQF